MIDLQAEKLEMTANGEEFMPYTLVEGLGSELAKPTCLAVVLTGSSLEGLYSGRGRIECREGHVAYVENVAA